MSRRIRDAIQLCADAFNAPTNTSLIQRVFTDDVEVYRFGVWEHKGELVESFLGCDALIHWLARTPVGIRFFIDGEISPHHHETRGEVFHVPYGYEIVSGGFTHGGVWLFAVSDDDRISWMEHHPRELDPNTGADQDWSHLANEHAQTEHHHEHSHEHDHLHSSKPLTSANQE